MGLLHHCQNIQAQLVQHQHFTDSRDNSSSNKYPSHMRTLIHDPFKSTTKDSRMTQGNPRTREQTTVQMSHCSVPIRFSPALCGCSSSIMEAREVDQILSVEWARKVDWTTMSKEAANHERLHESQAGCLLDKHQAC